jgi:hypothetical protein
MNQAGAAVLLSGIDRGGVVDVEAPLPWVLAEPLNQGRYDGLCYRFNGGSLKWECVGKELAREEEGVLRQKGDIDPGKLYHPWGKVGTLTAR